MYLNSCHISGKLFLNNMLTTETAIVYFSDWLPVFSGVSQGPVLGMLFFIMHKLLPTHIR